MTMEIDVRHMAKLARIALRGPTEEAACATAMGRILELVGQLDQAAADHLQPMANPHDQSARLRADLISEPDQRAAFQAIAPAVESGLYLVPRVIE